MEESLGEIEFKVTLLQLQQRDQLAWNTLVGQLRRVTLPWIAKRLGNLPPYALLSRQELSLEIFADSLSKFFDLFEKGVFTKPEALQSLMFKVAELKTMEAFRRIKKEALIYFPKDEMDFEKSLSQIPDWTAEDDQEKERARVLQQHLADLKEDDRTLLERFYAGEKMSRLAEQMNTTEENLRKRKQRALERLKQVLGVASSVFLLFWLTWIH